MKKTLLITGIIAGIFVLAGWVAYMITQEITAAYADFSDKLEVSTSRMEYDLEEKYLALLDSLNKPDTQNPNLYALMTDSLISIYDEYQNVLRELDHHRQYLEETIIKKDSVAPKDLNLTELKLNFQYWMGTQPNSNKGRGNGAAVELKEKLNGLSTKIETINIQIATHKNLTEWYVPEQIQDTLIGPEQKTWERFIFEGPVIANTAMLEALKADQSEKMKNEFDFYETVMKKK